ncbi:hypothetical protein PVK06_027563 [Gossypium arboreum]|uniref:Uncharacterized protein n=1 Tax=Gossypium arboreum TaxID=29729 RepID=A0ABR0P0K9_GOSAR|nr:hypothetical protein PVK06_027563 [Gossypium arboreum]
MEPLLFDFKDFSDINDFDFMCNGNDIMVNEAYTNLSKGIKDIGPAGGSNNNQPIIDEPNSNQILPAPCNELHESPPSASKPSQMPKTLLPLNQLIASPDLPNESFLYGWISDLNLKQPIFLVFEGNNLSLENDDDACQTTSPHFIPLIMERTNSFPLPLVTLSKLYAY